MYSWVLAATPFLLGLNIWGYASTIPLWRRTKRLLQAMQGMQGRAWLHCLGTSDTSARDREGGARASDGNLTEWWKHPVLGDWLSWFGFFFFIFYVVKFLGCWFDFRDIWQAPTDQRNKVPKDWQPPNYEAGMQGASQATQKMDYHSILDDETHLRPQSSEVIHTDSCFWRWHFGYAFEVNATVPGLQRFASSFKVGYCGGYWLSDREANSEKVGPEPAHGNRWQVHILASAPWLHPPCVFCLILYFWLGTTMTVSLIHIFPRVFGSRIWSPWLFRPRLIGGSVGSWVRIEGCLSTDSDDSHHKGFPYSKPPITCTQTSNQPLAETD